MKVFLALLAAVALVSCVSGPFYPQGPADLSKSAMFLPQNKKGTGIWFKPFTGWEKSTG
jgi:hypothetical protein